MQISQVGIDLIKKHEGLRLRAYLCPAGVWTIGYGTTGPHIKKDMVITKAEAEAYLRNDLVKFTTAVLAAVAPAVPKQNELDAMVSFTYNVGIANFKKSSVCKNFKIGEKEAAAASFDLWTKAKDPATGKLRPLPGLVARRTEEKQLFMADSAGATQDRPVSDTKTAPVPEASVVPTPPTPLSRSKEVIGGGVAAIAGVGQIIGSFTATDLEQAKTGTVTLQNDAKNSTFFTHYHLPEIAAGLTVTLSMLIIWKRFADRNKGVR
jgi:lysozyme